MMKLNQLFALFLVVAIGGLALAACSPTTSEPTVQPTTMEPAGETPAVEPTGDVATTEPTEEPTAEPTEEPLAAVSFSTDILPLLQSRCVNCHGGERIEEGLDQTSYTGLMAGSVNGPVVIAGDAENSLLVQLVTEGKMPKRGPKLTPIEVQLIVDWINSGALDN